MKMMGVAEEIHKNLPLQTLWLQDTGKRAGGLGAIKAERHL